MPREIQVHAGAESRLASRVFSIRTTSAPFSYTVAVVEVVDLAIGFRPHGMGEGACILGELLGLEQAHIGDALDGP